MIDWGAVAIRLQLLPAVLGKQDKDLAAAAQVAKTAWSNWKHGRNQFPPDAAVALWESFGVPILFVYTGQVPNGMDQGLRPKLFAMERHVQAEIAKIRRRGTRA